MKFQIASVSTWLAMGSLLGATVEGAVAGLKARSEVPAFNYDQDKVRGVNLGGWFVLEPYMTPSLFAQFPTDNIPLDEFHFTQQLGKDQAHQVLDNHWNTWITEFDFQQISEWGFNTVRIPIGYWAFLSRPEDPYVQGQTQYLDKALGWARNHNLKVWIDLHGVPGGQNGFDNSGLRDTLFWQDPAYNNIQDSLDTLSTIKQKYASGDYDDVISGIELVNEPLGPSLDMNKINDYYKKGYDIIRDGSSQGVVIHDAFQPVGAFNDGYKVPDFWNVVLDHHQYQVFSPGELQRSIDDHIQTACQIGRSYWTENLWRVTGEWSAALTDCSPLLNGVYRGARYDATYENDQYIGSCQGINDFNSWPESKKQDTRRYVEAQLDAYEQGNGWIFWSYKTENTIEWDVRALITNGLFPQPLNERWYPNQCGY